MITLIPAKMNAKLRAILLNPKFASLVLNVRPYTMIPIPIAAIISPKNLAKKDCTASAEFIGSDNFSSLIFVPPKIMLQELRLIVKICKILI